jgi:hypothetical protein
MVVIRGDSSLDGDAIAYTVETVYKPRGFFGIELQCWQQTCDAVAQTGAAL